MNIRKTGALSPVEVRSGPEFPEVIQAGEDLPEVPRPLPFLSPVTEKEMQKFN